MTGQDGVSRNAPCPCGSGRKAKLCHPDQAGSPTAARVTARDERAPGGSTLAAMARAADEHLVAMRYPEAIAAASEVLVLDGQNAAALSVLGSAAHRLGDASSAGDLLVQAVGLGPQDPVIRCRLADLLADLGLMDQAVEQYSEALRLAPRGPDAVVGLARCRLAAGDEQGSLRLLEQAVALDRGHHGARKALIWLHLHMGDGPAGLREYEKVLEIERLNPARFRPDPAGNRPHVGPVRDVGEWCRAHGSAYHVVTPAAPLQIARPRYAPDREGPPPAEVLRPERYVAVVPDILAVGRESSVIAADGTILSDIAAHEDADRFDLVRGAVRYMDRRVALISTTAAAPVLLDRAVVLTGAGSPNYYHWLLEHLTRLQTLELAAPIAADWPLVVDEQALGVPQLALALRRVAGEERRLVAVGPRAAVRIREAALVSPGAWLPIDLRDGLMLQPHDCIIDPAAIAWLRERLMPGGGRDDAPGARRIFLGRSSVGRLQNAADLAPVLAELGIETVLPERMSLDEQLEVFAGAALVVAESGAALTNIAFAPSSATVVVLGADRWDLTLFSQIAGHRGQRHLYVAGTPITGSSTKLYQSKFTLEAADLATALRDELGAHA